MLHCLTFLTAALRRTMLPALFLTAPLLAAESAPKPAFVGLDRDSSGKLSLEEYLASPELKDEKVAKRNFRVVDFDRDGALSEEEFRVLPGVVPIDQRGPVPDPVADLAANALKTWRDLLKASDADQDIQLSAEEWPAAALKEKLPPFGDLAFEKWDTDRSGRVDDAEAQRVIGLGYGTRSHDGTPTRSPGRVLYLSWIRTADRNRDHVVSRAEFITSYWMTPPERVKLFQELDKFEDGNLTDSEMLNHPGLNVDGVNLFLHLDKDFDGLVSAAELFGNPSTGISKRQAAESVEACDDDHDGQLSLREFQLAPAGLGYVTWRLFDRKDGDKDGFLGWKEFYNEESPILIGLAWDLFGRFDRNHDSRLGLDEFQFVVDPAKVPTEVAFRIKDADRDGRLLLEEVVSVAEPATEDPHDRERYRIRLARATERFQRDDADGNGSLDPAEYAKGRENAAREIGETPGEYSTRLFIADADGSNMKQLTDLPEFQKQGSPVWSSDGKFIAFDGWKPQSGQSFSSSQVVVVQSDGLNPRVLGDGAMPSFSPGGRRIAFSNPKAGGVWVSSVDGPDQELIQIDSSGWGTDWSSDGRLVYAANTGSGGNLTVVSIVEGTTTSLFDEAQSPYKNISWNMVWSPDGKRIAFKGLNAEGKEELGIVDARGAKFGHIRRFEGPMLASFAWSPIESRILFVALDPQTRRHQIYFVDPDTNDPPRLLPGQDDLRGYSDVSYSPDGRKIVFSCHLRAVPD